MSAQDEDERVGGTSFLLGKLLSDEDKLQLTILRGLEAEFLACLTRLEKQKGSGSRYISLARTSIENGVLWTIKEITGI